MLLFFYTLQPLDHWSFIMIDTRVLFFEKRRRICTFNMLVAALAKSKQSVQIKE